MSYSLTPHQVAEVAKAKLCSDHQPNGMAKWTVHFIDGHKFPYLSNDCRDLHSALLSSIERFGAKVSHVV